MKNKTYRVTALLPMKGNSERVPNKNLKFFNGKPLFHYVLTTLLRSKYIDKVIINTDSEAIATNAVETFGDRIVIHDRPEEIKGDFVSMNKIINYDVQHYESDYYIQTHSTNPLLRVETLDGAIEKMIKIDDEEYDSIFSVTKLQFRLYDKEGQPFNHNPKELIRTQDLEPLFEENSNFYIFSKESFENANKKRIGLKPLMFESDKIESIDIDELQDFMIAESIYKTLYQE